MDDMLLVLVAYLLILVWLHFAILFALRLSRRFLQWLDVSEDNDT